MTKKSYAPIVSYETLHEVEVLIKNAVEANAVQVIRDLVGTHGPRVGYKAFCYMLGGKMTASAMKPDEACVAAAKLEQTGEAQSILDAQEIYDEVATAYPDHPIASMKGV